MKTDNNGFRKIEDGAVVVTSKHSVFGDRLTTGTISVPVPNMPGVFALLRPGDHAKLLEQPERMSEIVAKARAAFAPPPAKSK